MKQEDIDSHIATICSGIAHEIRNPLQGIMASVAALSCRVENDASIQPFVEMINRETFRINQIIDDMLELAHAINFDHRPHDVTKLVEDAIRITKDDCEARKAKIDVQFDGNLPAIQADGQRLSRAFGAILRNAIESKESEAHIQIRLSKSKEELALSIQDDGPGVPDELSQRIFEPFFSTRRKKAGLGLTIANRVVNAHHGHIQVKSEKGNGTLVKILLPVNI